MSVGDAGEEKGTHGFDLVLSAGYFQEFRRALSQKSLKEKEAKEPPCTLPGLGLPVHGYTDRMTPRTVLFISSLPANKYFDH